MNEELYVLAKRLEIQTKLLDKFNKKLKGMPEGSLVCKVRKNNRIYFYQQYGELSKSENRKKFKQRYIKKCEKDLLEKLKRKKIIGESVFKLEENIFLIKKFISSYHNYFPDCAITNLPEEYEDIKDKYYLEFDVKDIKKWEKAHYEKNPKYSEGLIHRTTKGELVRSKSEALIALQLHLNGIPYRYEEKLEIEGKTFYPDFTAMRPTEGEIIYWEHFDLLSDEKYVNNVYEKIIIFAQNDIVLWDNLIITFDKPNGPIDVSEIQSLIRAKFF
nr:hypothetical protein [uncultured Aminipila sp.]